MNVTDRWMDGRRMTTKTALTWRLGVAASWHVGELSGYRFKIQYQLSQNLINIIISSSNSISCLYDIDILIAHCWSWFM